MTDRRAAKNNSAKPLAPTRTPILSDRQFKHAVEAFIAAEVATSDEDDPAQGRVFWEKDGAKPSPSTGKEYRLDNKPG